MLWHTHHVITITNQILATGNIYIRCDFFTMIQIPDHISGSINNFWYSFFRILFCIFHNFNIFSPIICYNYINFWILKSNQNLNYKFLKNIFVWELTHVDFWNPMNISRVICIYVYDMVNWRGTVIDIEYLSS